MPPQNRHSHPGNELVNSGIVLPTTPKESKEKDPLNIQGTPYVRIDRGRLKGKHPHLLVSHAFFQECGEQEDSSPITLSRFHRVKNPLPYEPNPRVFKYLNQFEKTYRN